MTGLVSAALHNNSMIDIFAPRFKVATRAGAMTDVLSPHHVRPFSDCEVRWFYEHLLGLPDPPTANLALDKASRAALMINFRHKLDSKKDIEIEGVVGLFRSEWKKQLASAIFCDDEVPETIGSIGERLVREYMERVAPQIWPAALHQPLHGVIGAVRIRTELDLIDVEGTIIDIRTSQSARMDQMHRFQLATCARLAPGASGVVRSDILVARNTPQHFERTWEVTAAEIHPLGLPKDVFDGLQAQLAANRSQFYRDVPAGPFYGYNRPGAKASEAVIQNWWRQGMIGSAKAHYDGIVAFSQTDFTEDLKKITVPVLVMHSEDDQIVPYQAAGPLSTKLLKNGTLKTYKDYPHGMITTQADVINADLLAFIKA